MVDVEQLAHVGREKGGIQQHVGVVLAVVFEVFFDAEEGAVEVDAVDELGGVEEAAGQVVEHAVDVGGVVFVVEFRDAGGERWESEGKLREGP